MIDAARHLNLLLIGLAAELAGHEDAPTGLAADYRAAWQDLAGQRWQAGQWRRVVAAAEHPGLPLVRMVAAGLDGPALTLLLAIGLPAEDPRLAALLGDGDEATPGGLIACFRGAGGQDDPISVKQALARLQALGLVVARNPASPRLLQRLAVPAPLWDALAGHGQLPGARLISDGPALADLVLSDATRTDVASACTALAAPQAPALIIRGPPGNGRRTLAAAIARHLGRPLLMLPAERLATPDAWREAALFALIHDAVLCAAPDLPPGATVQVPAPPLPGIRQILIMGPAGSAALDEGVAIALALPAPDLQARTALWQHRLPGLPGHHAAALAAAARLPAGLLCRTAAAAALHAGARGADWPDPGDAARALAELPESRLETVATRITLAPGGEHIALEPQAEAELAALVSRCRHREALAAHAGPGPGALGVRALFSGPSGAGKTLAARHLASQLGRELWRIDLAASVSKYIGETEKALDSAFSAAEARDVVLLLDEGDALMARRTDVGNANDRYANLETNFLLQRIEGFAGILIVTTNAAERIDAAFARRMDVVVPFRAAEPAARHAILAHQLAGGTVSDALLQEVAVRCQLSGGQLRNIALHARLLAIEAGRPPGDDDLLRAVLREYRKLESHCPLKPRLEAAG